nr:MAG TPA: hypothetical protein [Bacteriophage sp.]
MKWTLVKLMQSSGSNAIASHTACAASMDW